MRYGYLLMACALLTVGCSGSDGTPTSPSSASSLTGSWNGSVVSQLSGSGSARVTLNQNGSVVTGTWTASFPEGTDAGTVDGQVSGGSLQVMLNPGDPTNCPYRMTATVSGSTINGTYTSVHCTIAFGGSINPQNSERPTRSLRPGPTFIANHLGPDRS